jgi:RNA polymerase sigma-70 factor, ECF subfamily
MVKSQPAAEDAVQEALARAWERMDHGEHIDSLPGWVTVTASNLARSGLRRLRAERRATARIDPGTNEAPLSTGAEDRLDVVHAVQGLPRRQREVIVLHYYLDMSIAEIASAVKTSEGAVKNALYHARIAVAQQLGDPSKERDG